MKVFLLMLTSLLVLMFKEVHSVRIPLQIYAKTTSVNCYSNKDYISKITCRLRAINREQSTVDVDSDIVGMVRNMTVRFQVFKYTNQYRPFLINMTINVCELLETRHTNAYFQIILRTLNKFSSLNHTCPYTGRISTRGVFMDFQLIPFPVPVGRYKFDFTFYEGWPLEFASFLSLKVSVEERTNFPRIKKPNLNVV